MWWCEGDVRRSNNADGFENEKQNLKMEGSVWKSKDEGVVMIIHMGSNQDKNSGGVGFERRVEVINVVGRPGNSIEKIEWNRG